jgi:hypothetical protein
MCGTAFGPVVFGLAFEASGSYVSVLSLSIGIVLLAMILTALLRPFPDWESGPSSDGRLQREKSPQPEGDGNFYTTGS